MANTIDLDGAALKREFDAGGTVTPGMLVEQSGTDIIAHNSAAENAERAFALEQDELGNTISDNYASGQRIKVGFFPSGARVNALISTVDVTQGAFLESAGDGTLRTVAGDAATSQAQRASVVAVAEETVSNAGGSGNVRITVRAV